MDSLAARFLAWAHARGVQHDEHVTTKQSDGEGLGLIACSDLAEDVAVVTVPLSAVLRVEPTGSMVALVSSLDQVHGLALTLCVASSDDGGCGPWLALWPEAPVGSWELGETDWAQLSWWTDLAQLHAQQTSDARRAYEERIKPFCAERGEACPPWERFVWAVSMVLSRAAGVEMSGDKRLVLAPLLDLLNHRPSGRSNCRLCFELEGRAEGGAVVVRTTTAVAAGEALTITYGAKPNAELLAAYGFALRHNPHERALLRIPLAPDDPMRAQKQGMLPGGMGRMGRAFGMGAGAQ